MRFWRSKKVKEHLMKDNISIRVREEVSLILQVTGSYTGKPSTVSPLHTNLQVVNFQRGKRACQPLYASCCTVLLYFSRYCTVRLKMFIFCVCFLWTYYLCEKYYKPITVQYYIADCVCWTYKQTGLMNVLSEQNSFICRGLNCTLVSFFNQTPTFSSYL